MKIRRVLVLLVSLAAALSAAASQTVGALFDAEPKALWEQRASPAGIVVLYRAEALLDVQDGSGTFEAALLKLIGAPDTDPELKAHATSLLASLYRSTGRWNDAARLDEGLGYVRVWRVVGPFDDENKQGFDTAYPPESGFPWEGSFQGKGHTVSWRGMPVPAEAGLVPMDQLMTPSEKVLGYALTFIWVAKDTPAVLRGGYNEAYKLWVNGDLVAARKNYNGRAFDQYADPCTLSKGWNAVLVKICNQEAGWNFALRITDGAGNALAGWKAVADPAEVKEDRAAILAKEGAPPKDMAVNDPEARLRAMEKKAPSPRSEALLGQYLVVEKTFDRVEDPQIQLLRKAAEGAGKDGELWIALGDAESDSNKRRAAFQHALDLNPADPMALERMGRYYLRRGMPFPALDYIRKARKSDPSGAYLQVIEDTALLQFASAGQGAADLSALYEKHPLCTAVQEGVIEALKATGQSDAAAKALDAYRLSHQTDTGAWYAVASDLISSGKTPQALDLLSQMAARFPVDRGVAFRKASYLMALGREGEARDSFAPVLQWAPDWPEGQELMGDILEAEGNREGALAAYQQALILRPQMEGVKRKVAFLKPHEETFEARYRVEAKDIPSDLGAFSGQQAVVLLDNTAVKVEQSGLSTRYVQRVIQVLQPGAAQQMQSWPVAFDPDRQDVRIIEASILKADGRRVHAQTMVTDALSDPQYRLYYRNRNLILNFPSLAPGDRIWIEYKIADVGEQNEYGRYFGDLVPFAGMLPILEKQYTLIMPEDFPLYIEAKGIDSQPMVVTMKGRKSYRWVSRNIPRIQQEPDMPGFTEVAPYLHLSTFKDWDALGHWYAQFIADQWDVTPEIKAKVAELVDGAKTPEAKVEAIHRWVVQQTHYVGLEFGVHGFRPYKVKQIFDRRFGDCKDKAILMAAMLRQAGFDACMVLTRTRDNGAIAESPASLAIFNHAICYVPELNLFLDGTAEYSGLRELPYQDQGVWVQLVWPDGRTKRVETPVDQAGDNAYDAVYELQVPASGMNAQGKGSVTMMGQECSWVRRRYQDPEKQREQLEKDLSGSFPGTHLTAVKFGPLADLSTPVTIQYEGVFGQMFRPDGKDRLTAPIWLGRLNLSSQYASLQVRTLPLVVDYPWRQRYTVAYTLPPGAVAAPTSDLAVDGPFGGATRTVKQDGQRITVGVTVTLAVRRVEPSDYEAFRTFCQQVDKLADERIRIALPGGQP